MNRHLVHVLVTLLIIVGLAVHIGLGYRSGLVIAGIGVAAHLALTLAALAARKLLRGKADQTKTEADDSCV
ncbi:hypothetical protein [Fodinicola feengrottensis]|uniref:Uncharacterized protein n=1 Tax=Fodinicola feengrottensis TaxID=435914 RepID=A0ABP4SI45_9ACTN|nr:hypothetical protein [Fodinicola feengrottensis]